MSVHAIMYADARHQQQVLADQCKRGAAAVRSNWHDWHMAAAARLCGAIPLGRQL